MMKKLLLAILVAIPMLAVAQSSKFGVVNTQAVMEAMPDVKTVNEQVEAASKKYEDEFQKLNAQMDKEYADFQALDASTPESIKQRREQEIQELYQKLQQFRVTASQDLQRQHEQLMAPVVNKITTAINAVGKENGFTFIFESTQPIYTGDDVTDVTPLVKKNLGLQ